MRAFLILQKNIILHALIMHRCVRPAVGACLTKAVIIRLLALQTMQKGAPASQMQNISPSSKANRRNIPMRIFTMRFSANVKTHSTDNGGKHKLRKMSFADKKWGNSKKQIVCSGRMLPFYPAFFYLSNSTII